MASVWTNQACTERPVAGQTYTTLYVKLYRGYGFGDKSDYGDQGVSFNSLGIHTPDEETPDDAYWVDLWVDYVSSDGDEPFAAGQIVTVTNNNAIALPADAVLDFYEE